MNNFQKPKLLVFIVAYHAESTIQEVLNRIPVQLNENYVVEILIIDDSSKDQTLERVQKVIKDADIPFGIKIFYNPSNLGYGGNQKLGYHYAIENNFDFVALIHGDGQYAPELLPFLLEPLMERKADAVFGSRMLSNGGALKGGMPLYKFIGNKILTWFENHLLKSSLSEFHSGYRIYSVSTLKKLPFHLNTNDFHFDTEIIVQLIFSGSKIVELPIPTYYGDEICRVNGLKYALDVAKSVIKAKMQTLGLVYDIKFDCLAQGKSSSQYIAKLHHKSPHTKALHHIRPGSSVLDLGCAGGYVGEALKAVGCKVTGVDIHPPKSLASLDNFIQHDLNQGMPDIEIQQYDYILLLDVIEHLASPENFISSLYKRLEDNPQIEIIASTGNVAFFITRAMLLFGNFNYGKRGILDLTHTRLFTFSSFKNLFTQNSYQIEYECGIPAPYHLALGDTFLSRFLSRVNNLLIKLGKGLFSYQIYFVAKATPSLKYLIKISAEESERRLTSLNVPSP